MVDSNTIDNVVKTAVDVHGLGAEKGDEHTIIGEKVKCNGTKAPFHMKRESGTDLIPGLEHE